MSSYKRESYERESFKEEWEIWDDDPIDRIKIKRKTTTSKSQKPVHQQKVIKYGSVVSENYQVQTIEDIIKIWESGFVAVCTALTGAGKTYISALAARMWNADYVMIVGPTLSSFKWFEVLEGTGIPRNKIIFHTYHSVINKSNTFLHKVKYQKKAENGKIVTGYNFYPSEEWTELVNNNRVILIFDEYHKLQKQSQRSYSCSCLSRYILGYMNNSRVLCLSYTPNDNPNDVPMNMYLFNLIKSNKLIKYDRERKANDVSELESLLALSNMFFKYGEWSFSEKRDINVTYPMMINSLVSYQSKSRTKATTLANKIACDLYLTYIKKYITVTCIADWMNDERLIPNYNNVFCRVTPNTFKEISNLIEGGGNEKSVSKFQHIKDNNEKFLMAKLNDMQHRMELAKTDIYISIAKDILNSDRNRKVVIIVLFLDVLNKIALELKEYRPLLMHGKIKQEERIDRLNLFNEHNNNHRLFIATQETGGESIDLHDTSPGGRYPRTFIIPPNFKTKSVVQTAGRGFRQGVTSKCDIMIVYTLSSYFEEKDIKELPSLSVVPISSFSDQLPLKDRRIEKSERDFKTEMIPEVRFYNTISNKTNTIKLNQAEGQNGKLPFEYEPKILNGIYETIIDLGETIAIKDNDEPTGSKAININDYQLLSNGYRDPSEIFPPREGCYYFNISTKMLFGPSVRDDTIREKHRFKWGQVTHISKLRSVLIQPYHNDGKSGDILYVTQMNMIMLKNDSGWVNYISTIYPHKRI
jgi:hypothetical protein